MVGMNVFIMFALFGLGTRGVNWAIGECLALLKASRDRDAVHRAGFLILLPSRTSDVPANDGLDWKNSQLADLHCSILQHRLESGRDLWREVKGKEMGA